MGVFELRLLVEASGHLKPFEVEVDDDETASVLYDALASRIGSSTFGLRLGRTGETLHPDAALSRYELRPADCVTVTPARPTGSAITASEWSLAVVEGPGAGLAVALPEGTSTIGRHEAPGGVDLGDDAISRHHLQFQVAGSRLAVTDLDSTNGTYVDGVRLDAPIALAAGQHVGAGETLMRIDRHPREVLPTFLTYDAGALAVNRAPRVLHEPPAAKHELPRAPDRPPKRKLPLAASLIPVALGVTMAVVLGSPQYLIMTAAAPVMAITTYISDRRSGRSSYLAQHDDFLDEVDAIANAATRDHTAIAAWRHQRHPKPADVVRLAVDRQPSLWLRRPEHPDFLDLRIGTADQPSLVRVTTTPGGEDELARQASEVAGRFALDRDVPAAVPAGTEPIIGVVGPPAALASAARWYAAQTAVLHSPRETALAVLAPGQEREWDWAKWLPHTRSLTGSPTIAIDDDTAASLFEVLQEVVAERSEEQRQLISQATVHHLPHIVALVRPPVRLRATDVADLLERLAGRGITVIWFAEERTALPGACSVVVDAHTSELTYAATGHTISNVTFDDLPAATAEAVGLALAPLRDLADEGIAGGIPDRVDLVDLLGSRAPDPAWVTERWRAAGSTLPAIVGADGGGAYSLDIVRDGPHALVGGTTGSGKSELLQTLIASLAGSFSPRRVNFVLIDYKGGAAFKDCVELPHTVGFVTDLDGRLAERAIASLDAELVRRERLLADGDHKDIDEMLARDPDHAPPRLLLIVDEFAALKSEVPVFIDGVVDIARRGRSLGVHLILATQKPRGVISADIQANTNLRIALRVTDSAESTDIVGRADAARLPKDLPGRAFVRTGESRVNEVQIAYVGGASAGPVGPTPAHTFRLGPRAELPRAAPPADAPSDLTTIVDAARRAADDVGVPAQHRPWLPELPPLVPLDALGASAATLTPPSAPIGLLDEPGAQRQDPFVLELAAAGSAVFYGTSGSGKTTLLRTIAASLSTRYDTSQVQIYGLDYGGRALASIERLGHVGDVVFGDEIDRVRRFVAMLGSIAAVRRERIAEAGAATATEFVEVTGEPMPAIVTLIDNFGQLWSTLDPIDRGVHAEALTQLISEGRSSGLFFVLTADRRSALPPRLTSTIPERLALRLAGPDEFSMIGLRAPEGFEKSPPGRFWSHRGEAQAAVLGSDEDAGGAAQSSAIGLLANRLGPPAPNHAPIPVRLLPDVVPMRDLPAVARGETRLPIGLDEASLAPAGFDTERAPLLLVTGPAGSGRTTALATLTAVFRQAHPDAPAVLLGTRRSALFDLQGWSAIARGDDEVADVGGTVAAALQQRGREPRHEEPYLIVVDDADDLVDSSASSTMDTIVSAARDANAVVAIALTSFRAERAYVNWVQTLRHGRTGLILQPSERDAGDVLNVRLPMRAGLAAPPGRAYLVEGGSATLIHVAS